VCIWKQNHALFNRTKLNFYCRGTERPVLLNYSPGTFSPDVESDSLRKVVEPMQECSSSIYQYSLQITV
jgi:hypothetical protein